MDKQQLKQKVEEENRQAKARVLAAKERAEKSSHGSGNAVGKMQKNNIGGWLAAVVALGVISLAELSVIIVGGVNMGTMSEMIADSYRSDLYEMAELSENLNGNLGKLRVATGREEQRYLLTEILVKSELMEGALERFPVEMVTTNHISEFVNHLSAYAREELTDIASKGALGMENEPTVEYIYVTNQSILRELHYLRDNMKDKDWTALQKAAKEGSELDTARKSMGNLNDNVIQPPSEAIVSGPFATHRENATKQGAHELENEKEITSVEAEKKLRKYFRDYAISEFTLKGMANAKSVECYNYTLKDNRGREMYAQISKKGGKLVMFDSFEDCNAHNYDAEKCVEIAQKFLENLGMGGMKAVWLQENGTTAEINFACEEDGVVCYADMAVVKVCETKGKVTGFEGLPYIMNHGAHEIPKAKLTAEQAAYALGKIVPETARLALIPLHGKEVLTYEFYGKWNGEEYFVYVDAETGEEVQVYTITNTAQGRVLG